MLVVLLFQSGTILPLAPAKALPRTPQHPKSQVQQTSSTGRIAFISDRNTYEGEIYTMNADGSNAKRLTTNVSQESSPIWSPDGTRLLFESRRDGNSEVYVMDADGSNQTRLTRNQYADVWPTWSPDGKRIAYVSSGERFSNTFAKPQG